MALITSIPLELLQHIFLYACLEEGFMYPLRLGRNIRPMQHVLLQVCHHWHNSVCSASRLWSSVWIFWPPNYEIVDSEKIQRILQDVVRRSRTALLDIALTGDAWDSFIAGS
ncbi:hypothetical protein CYLTODRAFT_424562 [Cylindrobasidium torrendii FP15055 ss-10]|uniref:F-box domain-containing protein n=1 Tax=Cylindrobasidium torrendii FP15055 ss-10 TaxID=1314674 RepID=A0A0D7B405_9AGAR|nr:hypothetical protein CYLTODRAFT_424562 [Cylindrobasidium torrendii FP15055 ss-10]